MSIYLLAGEEGRDSAAEDSLGRCVEEKRKFSTRDILTTPVARDQSNSSFILNKDLGFRTKLRQSAHEYDHNTKSCLMSSGCRKTEEDLKRRADKEVDHSNLEC